MKAAVLYEFDPSLTSPQFVRYEEVPDPKIEKTTDVIVRIGGAGVCRTDLHIVEGIWRSKVGCRSCPISWGTRTPAGSRRSARASRASRSAIP